MNASEKRPNLLFVFSDQHRWCDLGCYGNEQVISPNLDAFAAKAVRFERCISNSPLCVPARGILLTGCFPLKHGALSNDLPIRHDAESYADVLARGGYRTGYIGKWHLAGVPRNQFIPAGRGRLGFQEWKAANCTHQYMDSYYDDEENRRHKIDGYEPAEQTRLAVEFIERRREGGPWSLTLSWGPPHDPYFAVPGKYLDLYKDADIRLRGNVTEPVNAGRGRTLTAAQIREHYRGYYAHITALDELFGELLAALERTGQTDNTVIVYTSDHGDMLGSQGLTNKQLPYEESVRVPLMVYWKGHTLEGAVRDELIGLVDLPVSLLGLLGLGYSGPVDGCDLHRLFTDAGAQGRESCYMFDLIPCHQSYWRGGREWRGICTGRYMFARTASDEGFALYDNAADPLQQRNLIGVPEARELRERLTALLQEHIDRHDRLLPGEELIREYGLTEEWNRSQAYFKLPLLVP